MPQSYTNLLFHCIFSTRDRLPQIDEPLRPDLLAYMGGIASAHDITVLCSNAVDDHVHLLLSMPPDLAIAEAMRLIKANSSKWAHERFANRHDFAWQTGYAAFTVSQSNVDAVRGYIANQQEHHRTVTFQEEFLAFLKRHHVKYDERYIWQ